MRLTGYEQTNTSQQPNILDNNNNPENSIKHNGTTSSIRSANESDDEEDGEWELAGGKSVRKGRPISRGSDGGVESRRRQNGSKSKLPASNSKADSNNNLSNDVESVNQMITNKLEISTNSNHTNSSTNLKLPQSPSPTSPPPMNPWAKIPIVQPAPIMDEQVNGSDSSTDAQKASYSMKTSFSMNVIPNDTTSNSLNHTLDSSDWPSLSSDLPSLNHSLNQGQVVKINGSVCSLPLSKSCGNFDSPPNEKEEKKKQPIKWKPLILEAPKRERKSYRGHGASRGRNFENGVDRKPSASRTRSLDRRNGNKDEVDDSEKQIDGETGEIRNRMVKSKSTSNRGFVENQQNSFNQSVMYQTNRLFTQYHPGRVFPTPNYRTPRGLNGVAIGGVKNHPSMIKRDTHKDYLYGLGEAIIVEEVPMILSVAPNGVYCTTVAAPIHHEAPLNPYYHPPSIEPTHYIPQNQVPQEQMLQLVRKQIEYYFSPENLETDIYLRRMMDANGFISLSSIADFNRVRSLSNDPNVIVSAVRQSTELEVTTHLGDDNFADLTNILVRPRVDPLKWPLANPESAAQTPLNPDVPEFTPKTVQNAPVYVYPDFNMMNPYYYSYYYGHSNEMMVVPNDSLKPALDDQHKVELG